MKKTLLPILLSALIPFAGNAQAPRKVILEDFTGTWCGFCPRGKTVMEQCIASYPNTIGMTVHNGDGLANTYSNAIDNGLSISGYPSGAIDRFAFGGSSVAISTSSWKSKIATRMASTSPVEVTFSSTYNSSTRALSVTVNAKFVGTASGDMRINCVLAEDGIVTSNDPQHNYMGQGCMAADPSSPWYNYPCDIANYVHDGVARVNLANDSWGTAGVIPNSVTAGQTFSKTFTYTVPSSWKPNNLYIIAFVSKYGAAANAREIMNADKGLVGTTTATAIDEQPSNLIEIKGNYPNPFTDVTALQFNLNSAQDVNVSVYDMYGKLVKTINDKYLTPGSHTFYWTGNSNHGDQVAPGIYFFTVSASGQSVSNRMVYLGQ